MKESNVKLCKTGQYWAHAQYEEAAHELALKRLKSNEERRMNVKKCFSFTIFL